MQRRPPNRLFVIALAVLAAVVAGGSVGVAAPRPLPARSTVVLAVDSPAGLADASPPIYPVVTASDPHGARRERRAAAVRHLDAVGDASLAPLLAALAPMIRDGRLELLHRFPAFGLVAVRVPPDQLQALRDAPGLRDLWKVAERRLPVHSAAGSSPVPPNARTERHVPAELAELGPAPRADHLDRIGAPATWGRLGGLGEGMVIGVIDSGADGRHPILAGNFRGRRSRRLDRDWLDLTTEASREPVDGNGHGTHVTGLAVGADGTAAWGAAPGAQWIAARAFDAEGNTDDLTLLAAADWMLHPGGAGMPPDPAQAPDIVNLSWTLDNGADDRFRPLIQAFHYADILPVCATGNLEDLRDPWPHLMAPASYPEALAVGALSRADQPWLWGRLGPGFYGGVKPQLLAPGEAIWSALPGEETGTFSGSSMAAPLVSGAAAVVWGQAPYLRADEVATILAASAGELGAPGADANLGWGRLDLAAAAGLAQRTGWVEGVVESGAGQDMPARPDARLRLDPPDDWSPAWRALLGRATTDVVGAYRLIAPEGRYLLRVSHPLDQPLSVEVVVRAGQGTTLRLRPLDAARIELHGRVRGALGAPLAGARLRLTSPEAPQGPSINTVSAVDGGYRWTVPPGSWLLQTEAEAHRTATSTLVLAPGTARTVDVDLAPAPRIVLVDADAWDDERIAPYLDRALDDAGLPHARRDILSPRDLPPAGLLAEADMLWWAHAYQSPGRLDQERQDPATVEGLTGFIAGGGHLLLSGQDVALWDQKRGLARAFFAQATGVSQSRDRTSGTPVDLAGLDLLRGLDLDAAWEGGSAKIRYAQPDSLDIDSSAPTARAVLRWSDGSAAAVARGGDTMLPGRRAFLGFGPESAGDRPALSLMVDHLARWMTPPRLRLEPGEARILPGRTLTLSLRLRGGGEAEAAELSLDWPPALRLEAAGGLRLDGATRAIWRDRLAAGEERRFDLGLSLSAPVTSALALPLRATLRIGGREQRSVSLLTPEVPDLRASRLTVRPRRLPVEGGTTALNLTLVNAGPGPATSALVTVTVPTGLLVEPSSLRASAGEAALDLSLGRITWRGDLPVGEAVAVDWAAVAPADAASHLWTAVVEAPDLADLTLTTELRVGGPRLRIAHLEPMQAELAAGGALDLGISLANDGEEAASAAVTLQATGVDASGWTILDPPNGRWTGRIPAGAVAGTTLRVRAPSAPRASAAGLLIVASDGLSPAAPVSATTIVALRWPDFSASDAHFDPSVARAGDLVSVTVRLANSGALPAEALAIDLLPPSLVPLPEDPFVSAGTVERQPGQLRWRCTVAPGARETMRYVARVGGSSEPNRILTHTVHVEGGREAVVLNPTLRLNPWAWSAEVASWPPGVPAGGTVEQWLVVRGQGLAPPRTVALSIDLPRALVPDRESLPSGLHLEPDGRSLRYDGALAFDGTLRLGWRASVAQGLEPGGLLFTGARISAAGMSTLDLGHRLAVSAADWSDSSLTASRLLPEPAQETELRLLLDNAGPQADRADLVMVIPSGLEPDPTSISTEGGVPAAWDPGLSRLTWQGEVASGRRVLVRMRVRRDAARLPPDGYIPLSMRFFDGRGIEYRRSLTLASARAHIALPFLTPDLR